MKIKVSKKGDISVDYSKEIARGARFLDEVKPGWEDSVKIPVLDISDGIKCICGQVFAGHYMQGMQVLDQWAVDNPKILKKYDDGSGRGVGPVHFGFVVGEVVTPDGRGLEEFLHSTLTEQWVKFLVQRKLINDLESTVALVQDIRAQALSLADR